MLAKTFALTESQVHVHLKRKKELPAIQMEHTNAGQKQLRTLAQRKKGLGVASGW